MSQRLRINSVFIVVDENHSSIDMVKSGIYFSGILLMRSHYIQYQWPSNGNAMGDRKGD